MGEENKRIEEIKTPKKSNNIGIIIIVIAVLLIGIGCGLLMATGFDSEKDNREASNNKENTENENNKDNKEETNNEEKAENENSNNDKSNQNTDKEDNNSNSSKIHYDTSVFIDIKDELENTNGNIYIKGEDVNELYINNKLVRTIGPLDSVGMVYKAYDYYILFTFGSVIGTTHIYVYDTLGNLTQEIYELNDDKMIIADSDKYRNISFIDNKIMVTATNIIDGPSLITDIDGYSTKLIFVCDNEGISKANIADDFLVYTQYQLLFKEDGKFEISRINGSEVDKTLGQIKAEHCR